jgi:hypothetical protein
MLAFKPRTSPGSEILVMMVLPSLEEVESFALGAENEHSARLLSLNKQHCRFRIDRCRFDLIQLLQHGHGEIAEQVFLAHRAGDAVVEDGQAVRCAHGRVYRPENCSTRVVITITKNRDPTHRASGAQDGELR